ncbi:hypothetical protein [Streptococcus sp. CSL10205-OR2]|uniref:hypothetical protein n=1 Tax=Streptococcus sp. CSL10205-OR2 TaxID=2980558 RepID=UPI0021D95E59|nr:hypothetical protein [Streptococcus sp. CSL10205-OR2]MCU9533515.1 hypothetical protein [Streptococcus sp. CSL10205-OR2]
MSDDDFYLKETHLKEQEDQLETEKRQLLRDKENYISLSNDTKRFLEDLFQEFRLSSNRYKFSQAIEEQVTVSKLVVGYFEKQEEVLRTEHLRLENEQQILREKQRKENLTK